MAGGGGGGGSIAYALWVGGEEKRKGRKWKRKNSTLYRGDFFFQKKNINFLGFFFKYKRFIYLLYFLSSNIGEESVGVKVGFSR